MNDKVASTFIGYINKMMVADLAEEICRSEFLCVLSDTSTDQSNAEEEIVYVRYMSAGLPVVIYVGLAELETATAPGILHGILSCISKETLSHCLVGFGADCESVMMGSQNGVAALIKEIGS